MTKIFLKCTGANLQAQVHGEITAGMRGIAVEISFDEAWQGLTPVLVVECAETFRKMAVDAAGRSSIPWECCISGEKLNVGVCGLNADGTVKLPTVWASCGRVLPSADDAQTEESSAPPTPTLLEQITALANQAQAAAHAVTEAAQRGDFNGQDGTTPNIQIGNVATVSSGTPAAVSRSGTNENPVFSFKIPEGKKGEQGDAGRTPQKGVDYFDGYSPSASVKRTDSGAIVTITDTNGTTTAVLKDGENGTDAVIDPTLSHPEQAADAAATGAAVGGLSDRVAILEGKPQLPPDIELRLKKLEAAAEGNLYMFWEDDTEGYTKAVPGDVLSYATLDKIGGKTIVQDDTLVSADVESVLLHGRNLCTPLVRDVSISTISGAEGNSANSSSTGYIPLPFYGNPTYTLSGMSAVLKHFIAAYDAQKRFCGRTSGIAAKIRTFKREDFVNGVIASQEEPAYIRITTYSGANEDIADADTLTPMLNSGTIALPYAPYLPPVVHSIPAAIRSLPGYGWSVGNVYNEVDYENKRYIQRVGNIALSALRVGIFNAELCIYQLYDIPELMDFSIYESSKYLMSDKYIFVNVGSSALLKDLEARRASSSNSSIIVRDTSCRTLDDFANSLIEKNLKYALKSIEGTDISALLPDGFENIEVEAGGTITFKQAGSLELPVPNQQTYMIKLRGGNT